jgi:hypothetical protein
VLLGGSAFLLRLPTPLVRLVGELARTNRLCLGLRLATLGGFGQPARLGATATGLDALLSDAALAPAGTDRQAQREKHQHNDDQDDDQSSAHDAWSSYPPPPRRTPPEVGRRRGRVHERSGGDASERARGRRAVAGLDIQTALDWRGRRVVDRDGEAIGSLGEIYLDESERPHWGSIKTGLFGLRQTLVPLTEVQLEGDELRVPYDGAHVKDAPNVDPDVQLTAEEEERLYRHYGVESASGDATGAPSDDAGAVAAAKDQSEAPAETATAPDDAMTRSEEEVSFGKRTRERERVRLKKYVVTDYVEKKVPVKREEVRLEREPPEGAERD